MQTTCPACAKPLETDAREGWVTCPHCRKRFVLGATAETVDLLPRGFTEIVPASESVLSAGGDRTPERTPAPAGRVQVRKGTGGRLERLGPYEITRELGRGAMGVVYEARDARLGRRVALKVIRAGEVARTDEIRRFKLEAQNAAKLKHPNIVPVYDVGESGGLDYFVMEYVEGEPLDEWLRRAARSCRERVAMTEKMASAVHHAHEQGIVHRDLKPRNVIVDSHDEPHVMDFGLARNVEADSSLTVSGTAVGTPAYMPPEQAQGRVADIDARSDVWSLGVVLYEMLTGVPPFAGETILMVMQAVVYHDPAPPRRVDRTIPRDVETICLKCLEKEPARRYQSAEELAEDCQRYLDGEPIAARPASVAYRARKKLAKHKVLALVLLAALAAILALAAFKGVLGAAITAGAAILGLFAWSYASIARERGEAVRQRERAETARREAEAARAKAESALQAERRLKGLERELGAAAEVQAALLPPKIPQIPGYDIYAYYRSAAEVGGDYYDFFPLDAERLGLVVADVSGKGIPGAMVMASTRALLRVLGPMSGSCAETLRQTNFHVARDVRRGMFVTAIFAVLRVHTREMTVCSAGHNPMVVYRERAQKCGILDPGGIALGFDKGAIFDRILMERTIALEPGDRVVLHTDGVVETLNSRQEEYGEERFYQFVLTHARMTSKDFVRALVRDLDEHKGNAEQHDDITIATIRVLC